MCFFASISSGDFSSSQKLIVSRFDEAGYLAVGYFTISVGGFENMVVQSRQFLWCRIVFAVIMLFMGSTAWSSCRPTLSSSLRLTIPSLSKGITTLRATLDLDMSMTTDTNLVLRLVSLDQGGEYCNNPPSLTLASNELVIPEVEYLGMVYTNFRFKYIVLADGAETFQSNPPSLIDARVIGNWKMVFGGEKLGSFGNVTIYSNGGDAGILSIDAFGNYTWGQDSGKLTSSGTESTCIAPSCWLMKRGIYSYFLVVGRTGISVHNDDPFVFYSFSNSKPIIGTRM